MKTNKLIFAFMIFSGVSLFLMSCKKESSNSLQDPALTASKTTAAIGESINLSIANLPAGNAVDWESSANATIVTAGINGENATVTFNTPGTYTVTAYLMKSEHADGSIHHNHSTDSTSHHQGADSTHHHHAANSHHHHHNDGTVHSNEHEGNLIEKSISITIR